MSIIESMVRPESASLPITTHPRDRSPEDVADLRVAWQWEEVPWSGGISGLEPKQPNTKGDPSAQKITDVEATRTLRPPRARGGHKVGQLTRQLPALASFRSCKGSP